MSPVGETGGQPAPTLLGKPVSFWQDLFFLPLRQGCSAFPGWRVEAREGVLIDPRPWVVAPILHWLRDHFQTTSLPLIPPGKPFRLVCAGEGESVESLLPSAGCWPIEEPIPWCDCQTDPITAISWIKSWQAATLGAAGVVLLDPQSSWLGGDVEIASGVEIHAGVVISGSSRIGAGTRIAPHCVIENTQIGEGCTLLPGCVIRDSEIADRTTLGPYCHLREHTVVLPEAKVGNFVEMKKTVFGEGSKAMHLSYLGDATIGSRVNVGAGTITCNYDGTSKHPTVIEEGVFIGSGTELVAPLTVHQGAYVGAGSTLTEDVPGGALAIARARQLNIPGWSARKRAKS